MNIVYQEYIFLLNKNNTQLELALLNKIQIKKPGSLFPGFLKLNLHQSIKDIQSKFKTQPT